MWLNGMIAMKATSITENVQQKGEICGLKSQIDKFSL